MREHHNYARVQLLVTAVSIEKEADSGERNHLFNSTENAMRFHLELSL